MTKQTQQQLQAQFSSMLGELYEAQAAVAKKHKEINSLLLKMNPETMSACLKLKAGFAAKEKEQGNQRDIGEARAIAKLNGLKLVTLSGKTTDADAWYDHDARTIILNSKSSFRPISNFFHELGHHYAAVNKFFPLFHGLREIKTEQDVAEYKAVALGAERWVDEWGREGCLDFRPDVDYVESYGTDTSIAFLMKELEKIKAPKAKAKERRRRSRRR